jgi:hypothetical protein
MLAPGFATDSTTPAWDVGFSAMNSYPYPLPFLLIPIAIGLVSLAWYVGVIVMLFKIWQKVKHLPG